VPPGAAREAHFTYAQRLVKVGRGNGPIRARRISTGSTGARPASFERTVPSSLRSTVPTRASPYSMCPPLDPPLDASPEAVRSALAPLRHDFSVALWTPGNAFAVGAVIRVAHTFLAKEIFLVGDAPYYPKASMGMHKYETLVPLPDANALLDAIGARPAWAVEKDHARRSIHAVSAFPRDVVLLFGSERFGLPKAVLDRADDVVGIPVYGVNQSLPLAVAAGIVMSEWARLRYARGAVV
jgi:tRNA(Leu) C34 or U34 (ribose-2'-O)-methylase TrmL